MGRFVFALSVGIWLGTVVSFSFIFLPVIHAALDDRERHALLTRIFPRYYVVGIACGLLALAAVSLAPPSPTLPFDERLRLAFPVVVSLLCSLSAQYFLLPRLNAERQAEAPDRFARLHQFAAMLNSTVLAMLVLATAAVATR